MRFVCDSCRAQYMISDDKVGAKGVKVRCKKCGYNIVVRPAGSTPVKEDGPSGEAAGAAAASQDESNSDSSGFGLPSSLGTPPEGGLFGGVEDDELGAVFDQVLNSGSHRIPAGEAVGPAKKVDAAVVSNAGEAVRKLVEAEAASVKTGASHEWFVAIDDKQVGPLSMEKVKDHWDRGEVGPDSLCWRAGFSDWIPLSETSELASVLAPRPSKPVIVAPVPMESSAPVSSAPVESAFSAGGSSKAARSESPVSSGPAATQESSGWKPSAASVLASLVKEENDALTKPAAKAAPVAEKPKPVVSGLLDVPPPEAAPVAAQSPLMAEAPAPAPYLAPQQPQAYAPPHGQPYAQPQHMPQAYAQPQYPGYPPPAAPAPKQGSKMGVIIGVAAGVVMLAGGAGIFFATRPAEPVAPPVTQQQMVAQAPTTPAQPVPTPPPAEVAQNTQGTAGTAAQPAVAPTTPTTPAPTTPAPAVAAAGTPATTNPAPTTPPPAETVKPVEPQKQPEQIARAEVPDRTSTKRPVTTTSRPAPTRPTTNDDDEPVRAKPQPAKASGSADDEFDELFGTTKKPAPAKETSANGRSAYIPPEPGGGGAALDRLGQSDIMQVVLANKPAIIKCVSEQKKKDPGLSGKLVMRWVIQTNGTTKNVSCQTAEFRSTYMATCISGLIKGWSFPKHKVQGEPIDFPFTF
jgi:predicted Zn finger-like uncharacterized protein